MKNNKKQKNVAILGASNKPDRYSHMALMRLQEYGYSVIPVNPAYSEIDGIPVRPNLETVRDEVGKDGLDTLTIYLAPRIFEEMAGEIVSLKPRRVIFNPGTESTRLQEVLDKEGIPWQESCTLVLLGTGQF